MYTHQQSFWQTRKILKNTKTQRVSLHKLQFNYNFIQFYHIGYPEVKKVPNQSKEKKFAESSCGVCRRRQSTCSDREGIEKNRMSSRVCVPYRRDACTGVGRRDPPDQLLTGRECVFWLRGLYWEILGGCVALDARSLLSAKRRRHRTVGQKIKKRPNTNL